jgi:predicted nucleic acid-binding protein
MTIPPQWGPLSPGPPEFVLDTSVALFWLFGGPGYAYAGNVASRLHTATAVIPATWAVELAETIRRRERAGQATVSQVTAYFVTLHNFRFAIDDRTSVGADGPILALARTRRVSVFEAAYLELASRLGLPWRLSPLA